MTDHNLLARIQELIRERDDYERRFRSAQDSGRTLVHDYGAQRDEARATKDMFKERFEAQQLLHLGDITRARRAGQGQALKELLEEIDWVRTSEGDLALDHLEGWARDKLKELGEEPREVR